MKNKDIYIIHEQVNKPHGIALKPLGYVHTEQLANAFVDKYSENYPNGLLIEPIQHFTYEAIKLEKELNHE